MSELYLFPIARYANLHWQNSMRTYSLFQSNNFSFACKVRHASKRSKAIPSGMNAAVSPSANHWIMLIASDEWYYSVTPATLMAIHLDPSLPVISQPHVFWERVGGERQAGADVSRAFVHHPFRSGSRFIRTRVQDYAVFPQSSPVTVHSNCRYRSARRGAHDAKLIISRISVVK